MGSHKPYNGHKNWNHWNVSLWINNDEELYNLARDCIATQNTRREAAELFLAYIPDEKCETPDGAPYTVSSVLAAMRGLEP